MKLTYSSGNMTAEFECETQRDGFGQISAFQEVFEQTTCGKCQSTNVQFRVRPFEDCQYYEIRCRDCAAKLAFGCNKLGGGLFPKRKDSDGNWLADRGWLRWNAETKKEE
jgi:hypothetical protein